MPRRRPRSNLAPPKGKIVVRRDGYWRAAYTKADGTRVKRTWIPAGTFLVKDRGRPGKTSRGAKSPGAVHGRKKPWIQATGALGGRHYAEKPERVRRSLLGASIKRDGYRTTLGRLEVLLRSSELKAPTRAVLTADKKWLVRRFGGKGSFGGRQNPCLPCAIIANPKVNPAKVRRLTKI